MKLRKIALSCNEVLEIAGLFFVSWFHCCIVEVEKAGSSKLEGEGKWALFFMVSLLNGLIAGL